MPDIKKEVTLFSHYLIKRQAPAHAQKLYAAKVAEVEPATISPHEQRQLAFALAHPAFIGLLDAGLALTNPHAELRRRIYIVLSILETTPEYHDYFMVKKRGPLYIMVIAFVGIRAGLRALAGIPLVMLLKARP